MPNIPFKRTRETARRLTPALGILVSAPIKPEIIIEITLLSTEAGGRLSSISSGEYRGILSLEAQGFSVRWFVPTSSPLVPGGRSSMFGVQFLVPDAALPFFPVGATFSVWEGRTIGTGVVREVVQHA